SALGIAGDTGAEDDLKSEVGSHPYELLGSPIENVALFTELYTAPMDQAIDKIVVAQGGRRVVTNLNFIADRRLEVLAHAFGRSPRVISELRTRLALLPPEEP